MTREEAVKAVRATLYDPPNNEPFYTPQVPTRAEIYATELISALEALGLLKLDDSGHG